MTYKVNPFQPNLPVNTGAFVGRLGEVMSLEEALVQTRAGRPKNILLTGERGIGKTSLLTFIRYVARGLTEGVSGSFNFLVIETDIDATTSQHVLAKKVEIDLNRELAKTENSKKILKDLWAFVRRWEVLGVKIREEAGADQDLMLDDFAYSLAETAKRICTEKESERISEKKYEGIAILIDEADNASSDLSLGAFFKLLTERLQRHECNNVMFVLAGLPEVRDLLRTSHASSLRVFDEITLGRLSNRDAGLIIARCLQAAERENGISTTIEQEARDLLVNLSEGYPHFIQQFGFCAFKEDKDNCIDKEDVLKGAFSPRGAIDLIGDRYYRDDYFNKISANEYRQVLGIMAERLDGWVTKSEIRKNFKGKASTLDNAIKALRDRRIILDKEGERGVYRLQHKGFAIWIRLQSQSLSSLQTDHPVQVP